MNVGFAGIHLIRTRSYEEANNVVRELRDRFPLNSEIGQFATRKNYEIMCITGKDHIQLKKDLVWKDDQDLEQLAAKYYAKAKIIDLSKDGKLDQIV